MGPDDEDESMLIDIAAGEDDDGMPTVVPAKFEPVAKTKAEPEPRSQYADEDSAELESARKRMVEAQERIGAMHQQVEQERAARQRAEKDALEASTHAWRSHMAKLQADSDVINTGLDACAGAQAAARRELRAAEEAGDVDRKIAATEALTLATSRLEEYQRGKRGVDAELARNKDPYEQFEAAVSERQRKPVEEPKKPEPKQLSPDEWVDTQAPSAIRGWLKENREFIPGGKRARQLNRFVDQWLEDHDDDRGTLDTKKFARALEEQFTPAEEVEEVVDEPVRAAPKPQQKNRTAAAAPVSRDASVKSNGTGRQIRLPPDVAAFVRQSGLDPTKYAEGVVQDMKEGRLPKEWLDPEYDRGITPARR